MSTWCSKRVEVRNILIIKYNASSWLILINILICTLGKILKNYYYIVTDGPGSKPDHKYARRREGERGREREREREGERETERQREREVKLHSEKLSINFGFQTIRIPVLNILLSN